VTAIPAIANGCVYFPDSAGFIYKVSATNGSLIWSKKVSDITGIAGDYARTTPAVTGNILILGTQTGKFWGQNGNYATTQAQVFALTTDGSLLWHTVVDQTPQSMVTTSAVVVNGTAIVGVASNEELTAAFVPYPYFPWSFRGSAVALDVATGTIKWQTYTVPPGYFGGAIWGSTPSVDLVRNQVYVSSGDNYMAPQSVLSCLASGSSLSSCDPANYAKNYADSIIAIDLTTHQVNWAGRGMPMDIWSVACGLGVPGFTIGTSFAGVYGNCPDPTGNASPLLVGPDYDFAQGPMMFSDTGSDTDRSLVGAGGKSGLFWAFRAKDGFKVWSTQVSPGGVTGGMQWGSATDGTTLYVSASNAGPSLNGGGAGAMPWTLMNGQVVHSGGWAAVDAATGKVKWTTSDPEWKPGSTGARAEGPVTLANGVVFGCNMNGSMYALNAKTGAVLWHRTADVAAGEYGPIAPPCIAGASIVNGKVFWGSGDGRGTSIDPMTGKPIVVHPYKLYMFGF
jgi:polyvinyl alcohol dehydrogenase (cytochrome)